jgi:hypothetical protein
MHAHNTKYGGACLVPCLLHLNAILFEYLKTNHCVQGVGICCLTLVGYAV